MRTATRAGDLGHVEGRVRVVMGGGGTQDERTARDGDPEEGDPGGMWGQDWGPPHEGGGWAWGWS